MHASQESSTSSAAAPLPGDKGKKKKGRKAKKAAEALGTPFKALSRAISGQRMPACLGRWLHVSGGMHWPLSWPVTDADAPVHAGHPEAGD